mmetsp:Transcript_10438/g.38823  ORF Transcript_10438/g.38823 Transcript_10438/m.38823 type:complete len:2245 (-) Transcript_10438:1910-8644(-)|eukprot:CAMPEP_0117441922 /NCGR_PEP_ID=MMETSP0759-20121206/3883_1 /TAXON_ID=63605 /ORGANISM="Percolomonas cosmopolitus, Strain WS" /LENGTH=2244 /DNA_ID=CAMNT_0005233789 /DNA_START=451 /DNA_END=7185 /DNA_ORIENTATION=-
MSFNSSASSGVTAAGAIGGLNVLFHNFLQRLPLEINAAPASSAGNLSSNVNNNSNKSLKSSAESQHAFYARISTFSSHDSQAVTTTGVEQQIAQQNMSTRNFTSITAEQSNTPGVTQSVPTFQQQHTHLAKQGTPAASPHEQHQDSIVDPPNSSPSSNSTKAASHQNIPTPPSLYHQLKFHYKSSKQSYLFECLQFYEKLLDEDQMQRNGSATLHTAPLANFIGKQHDDDANSSQSSKMGPKSCSASQNSLPASSSVEPVIPQWSLNLYSHWSGDKRVIYMLQLGNVYLEYGHYAEANYWLHATKALCQEIISSQSYDPYLEYLFTEAQYSVACTLFNAHHWEESVQYLEASYQRVVNLISSFMHPHIRLEMQNDLAYNVIMLYIKILLQAALHQSNHDTYQFNSILVNQSKNDNRNHLTLRLLQKAMNLFMIVVDKDHSHVSTTDPVTNQPTANNSSTSIPAHDTNSSQKRAILYISNFYHRKNTIHLFYLIAKHLNMLDFDMLAKDFIDKITPLANATLHTSHSLLVSVTSMSQQLQKQFASQQQRLRVMQPSKQQSKLSILSQFTEDETDDEDDWSYDDDDEDEDEGLSSRLRNRLTTTQQPSPSSADEAVESGAKGNPKKGASQRNILKDSIFPDKFRFFKSRDLTESTKERKVLGSMLFSLRLSSGKQKFDNIKQHREWLSNVVSRHNLDPATHSTNENIIVNNFVDDLRYIDEFSIPWAIKFNETCEKLFHLSTPQSFQQCNEILVRFFTMLPEAKMTENIDVDDLKNYVGLFNIGIELLRIAALTVFPQNREEFSKMKDNLQQFYPKYMDYVTLIDIEALIHNLGPHSNEDDYIISTLLQMYEKYHTMLAITPGANSGKLSATATDKEENVSGSNARNNESNGASSRGGNGAATDASNASSSNSSSKKSPVVNSLYHIRQGYELACHSILILHHYLSHLSPITRAPLQNSSSPTNMSGGGVDLTQHAENIMMDIHHRIQVLDNLYTKIPFLSSLKARVAFTIGNYFRVSQRNLKMAERALFESVYIFDQVSFLSILSKRPPILSLFGLCALSEYAETLLERGKYSVASICFDNLVFAHTILYGEHNYKLINKLAVLCAKNNDWGRSAQYILILLEKAQNEKNIPKVVFLSEKLSREYMERGDFRNAEHYISQCVEFIEDENARSTALRGRRDAPIKTDLELKLQLKLAHLFLQGYYFERGIDLLAKLMDQKLTAIQKCQVLLELSEAYLKKRWLKESEIVLEKLVKHLQTHHIILGNLEVFNHVSMLQVASRLYYRKGQYTLSLFCVNTALQQCDPSHLPRFANLFRLKGKIFHAISSSSSNISFPTTMDITDSSHENGTSRLIISLFQALVPRQDKGTQFFDRSYFGKRDLYRSSSEALNDALKYYEKSVFCYNAINDCINVTRIHLHISRAQIEYLFAPMAFLQCKRTMKFFNNEFPDQEFAIDLQAIENDHVVPAIETSVNTTSIMLALDSYITMAELRCLQGRKMSSQEYWTECLHIMFTLFMKGTQVVVRKGAPPGFLEGILNVVKRLVRLMFCYHKQFVNDNLAVIDALLMLERELLQVLKRHNDHDAWASTPFDFDGPISGSSTTSSVSSSMSTGNASTDQETISHLIKQNKVYQALPCNHSITKSKSLPFLRRRKKKGSLKKLSLSSLRSRSTGTSHDRSRSLSTGGFGSMTEGALTMSERVNERIWGCFFRMKQHQRKFSSQNITQQELGRRNQESMRRLWSLMKALREKVDNSSLEVSVADDSIVEDDETTMNQIDEKIRRLSLESADNLVVNCLYKTIGSQKKFKHSRGKHTNDQKHHHERRHPSLPSDISFIKLANSIVDEKMLQRLVYIVRLDDIIVYYLPFTGERRYQKFGGRDLEGENNVMWIDSEINDFIQSVLTQGRRKKMKTGEDDTALSHMTQLFHEAPFSYHPPNSLDAEDGDTSDAHTSLPHRFSPSIKLSNKVPKFKKKMIPSILQSAAYDDSLYLIVSHHLQVIPWESLFTHFSARHFTLQGLIERRRQNTSLSEVLGVDKANPTRNRGKSSQKNKFKPCFFMLYSEDEPRFIMPLERDRKAWIYSDLIYELSLTPDNEKPSIVHDILPNLPLHAPVIKYGKRPKSKSYRAVYKPINFIQLSRIAQNTHNIFTHIESYLNQHQYPVFIFTFGDLVDLSECIHYLISYRRDCTLLFIPEKYIIHATKTICLMQKSFTVSNSQDVATHGNNGIILNQSIQWLRKMMHIPIAVVNPM